MYVFVMYHKIEQIQTLFYVLFKVEIPNEYIITH